MKNFDMTRFVNLLKLDVSRNKRAYFFQFLSMLVAFLLVQFALYYPLFKGYTYSPVQLRSVHENMFATFLLIEAIFSWVFISNSFTFLNDKNRRINYFLLPATNLEKFISRILIHSLGMFVLSLFAFVLADLTVIGVLSFLHISVQSVLPYSFHESLQSISRGFELMFDHGTFVYGGFVTVTSILTYGMLIFSLYLFSSVLLRKHPFILMSFFIIIIFILLSMLVLDNVSGRMILVMFRNDGYMSLMFFGLTCVFTALSYRLFKRKGAINSTFF